jgi:hypothetical protein
MYLKDIKQFIFGFKVFFLNFLMNFLFTLFINYNVMYKITLNNIELKINYAKVYYQARIYFF